MSNLMVTPLSGRLVNVARLDYSKWLLWSHVGGSGITQAFRGRLSMERLDAQQHFGALSLLKVHTVHPLQTPHCYRRL